LPEAVLAAIVIHAVWHLLDYKAIAHFRRISLLEFRESLAAILGVIAFDILNGLALGRAALAHCPDAVPGHAAGGCVGPAARDGRIR